MASTGAPFRLSVLDQSPISQGSSGARALANTLDLARQAKTLPGRPHRPEPWLLGSSQQSAIWAAELGLPYAFADFINPRGAEIAALYRERFAASSPEGEREHAGARPRTAVGVWVICADSDEEAQRLAASGRMTFTLLRRGQLIAVPPPEQALRFLASEDERGGEGRGGEERGGDAPRSGRRAVVGSPQTVRTKLAEVVDSYGAEEAIVVCITYDHEARRRSYELLAESFELSRS